MATLKELVKNKAVRVKYYRDGELWYETDDGFDFPIPIRDTGSGVFKAEDKAINFMRWIRKHLVAKEQWEQERATKAAIWRGDRLHNIANSERNTWPIALPVLRA